MMENAIDNDKERKKRRSVYNTENAVASTTEHSSIALMDMEQIKNHINMCQKLFYENKINIHNAWNVRIIDYINSYVSNNKIDAETISIAATTLDICLKVFGYKLEYLGKEIIKLVQTIRPTKAAEHDEAIVIDNLQEPRKSREKRKNRRSKCTIVKDKNSLLYKEIPKGASVKFAERLDVYASSSENMFINRIPMDHAVCKFNLMNSVENGFPSYEANERILSDELFSISFPKVKPLAICPQFRNFNVDELDDLYNDVNTLYNERPQSLSPVNNEVAYDDDGFPIPELDGSIHDIFEDNMNDVDYIEEIVPVGQVARKRVEMITSLCPANEAVQKACELSADASSLLNSIWVGPSHWKNKLVRPLVAKFSGKSSKEGPPPPKRRRKTTEREDFINFVGTITGINLDKKITKIISLNTDTCTLPLNDICSVPDFDILNLMALNPTKEYCSSTNETQLEPELEHDCLQDDILENNNSLEFVESDISNMDQIVPDSMDVDNNNITCSTPVEKDILGLDINTQAYVPYAIRTKRVNMKKLKKAMWECLVENCENNTNMKKMCEWRPSTTSTFSEVYKKLYNKLPRKIRSEISVPLAFFCLLHLTNDHNLKLEQFLSLKDVKIN